MNLKEMLGDAYKEGMTLEEIETALADFKMPEAPDNSAEIARLKASVDKATAEASKYKKELNAKLSSDEVKAKEDAEALQKLVEERDNLLKEKNMSNYRAKFLENGYDKDLAEKSASALVEGDFATVFDLLGKHTTNLEKKFKSEAIDRTPKPSGGDISDHIPSKAEFDKMSYQELNRLAREQPEIYKHYNE